LDRLSLAIAMKTPNGLDLDADHLRDLIGKYCMTYWEMQKMHPYR
jgi:hypothetical protein